jgi:hypothetical protein
MATRRVGLLRLVDLPTYEAIGTADEVTRADGYALEVCHLRGEGIGREVVGEGCRGELPRQIAGEEVEAIGRVPIECGKGEAADLIGVEIDL